MMSDTIEVLGWTLLHFVWQGTLVGVLAAMLLVALRRRSTNARYLAAVAALGLMLLLPLGTIAWIEQTPPVGDVAPIFNTVSMIEIPRTREDGTLALDEPPITVERIGVDVENPPPPDAVPLIPVSGTGQTILEDLAGQRSEFRVESFLKPFIPWAVAAWLIGVGILSLRLFASWLSVQRLRRRATQPASENWQALLCRLAKRLRVTRPVKLVESALVEVPAVIGWLRPVILIPATAMTGLTTEQLEALLAHELAHVRRHDYLINLLQTVVETLLFYHPAVWWLSHRIRLEREHCCDDLAVQACGDRVVYAKALVALEELRGPKLGLAMSSRGGSLLARVARLLGQAEQQRQPVSWIAGLLSLVLLTTVGAFGAGLLTPPGKPDESLSQKLSPDEPVVTDKSARPIDSDNDWPQWGRSSHRNNVAKGRLPLEWDLEKGTNVVWKAKLGTSTYSSPIISGGKVFIGTNNGAALNPAHPQGKDMSCLVCFEQSTGKFLWQYASEKLPTGRVHDWPGIGLCSTACVAGDRVWVVTNRCEVICLDADGFRDGENDGPFREEPAQTEIDADVIWKFDMFGKLGVRPLHQSVSSITQVDGVLLLNTSNGPDETLVKIPAPHAPNFLALDAKTGRVIWSDNSAGESIVVGGSFRMCSNSCSGASPSVATLGGVTQAIFSGKEGWVYSFDFTDLKLGKTTLLWQFDCNPKTAKYVLGRSSRRLTLLASPVIADDRVYVATGQNPEMGEGEADLWCIDPTKRGDLSTELVFNKSFENGEKPIPHKPLCACETDKGDFVRPNPNAGAIWHYSAADRNGNGKIEFEETFHCTLGNPVIHNGLLFVSDYSGLLHCLDSRTGEVLWTHDLISASWSTCAIADGHVIIGDEDGDLEIFKVARTKQPVHSLEPRNFRSSIYSTPVVVSGMLVVATKDTLVAIRDPKQGEEVTLGAGLLTPPDKPTEGLPNDTQRTATKATDTNEGISDSTEPRAPTANRNSVRGSLRNRISLNFENTPLPDVIEHIGRAAKFAVRLDKDALENEGIGAADTPVSIRVHGISTASALQLVLQPLNLGYLIEDETLVVTTVVRVLKTPIEEQIDLGKTLTDEAKMSLLRDAIHTFIEPKTWDVAGGLGSIRFSASREEFIVRHVPSVQYDVNRFLRYFLSHQTSPETQRLWKLLSQRFTLESGEVTLLEAMRKIATAADANVVLDSDGLSTSGVRSNQRVILNHKDAPLRDVLDSLCKPLKLRFRIRNEVIQITDGETAQGGSVAVLYPFSTPLDDLTNLIQKSIRPESWKVAGGKGTIEPHRAMNSLIIRQDEVVHNEIDEFFAKWIVPNANAREAMGRFVGRVRLKLDGEKALPDLEKVEVPAGKVLDESLVFSKDGGLANVFVYLPKPTFPVEPPLSNKPPKPFVLIAEGEKFWPHVAFVQNGRPIVFENRQKEPLNFRIGPLKNVSFNVLVKPQDLVKIQPFRYSERLPFIVKSDVSPWLQAYLLTLDHPFAAVTDTEGRFTIDGLPPGEHEFRVWHERVGYLEKSLVITIKSGEDARMELEYKPDQLKLDEATVQAWGARLIDATRNPQPRAIRLPAPPKVDDDAKLDPSSGAGGDAQRESPDPDSKPTAGLADLGDSQHGETDKQKGDLRSKPAAGSGDPRRAQAIERGVAFLKAQQQENGTWQGTPADGVTALCAAALLQAGVKADDPVMQKALAHLRKVEPTLSYTVALQTIVFCLASPKEDAELIRRNVVWLEKAQVAEGKMRGAWSYQVNHNGRGDGSCSRFAVLGLDAAKIAGFEVQPETWRRVSNYWLTVQKENGGWGYTADSGPTLTMTLAGIAGLATANRHLPNDDQTKTREAAIRKPVDFLEKSTPQLPNATFLFYALHSLERAGHLGGIVRFGEFDWRADTSKRLLETQQPNGSWKGGTPTESELVATSFALLAMTGQPIAEKSPDAEPAKD